MFFGYISKMASTYEFTEKVLCIDALNWSNDFRLALCTETSVKILTLYGNPSHHEPRMKLKQSSIPADKDVFDIPKYDVHQHRQLNFNLPRDDINALYSDKIMNPFKYTQDILQWTGYCATTWSPPGADHLGRSIIGTLSSDCRLMVHTQGSTEYHWEKIADLTVMQRKATKPSADMKSVAKYYQYRKWCYSQAVTAIGWCPLVFTDKTDGSQFSILAAGTHLGNVDFWKVKMPCSDKSDCTVLSTNTDHSNKVLCMAWTEAILAVSHYRGNLTVGKINSEDGSVNWAVMDTSEDLMKVSCMCFCKADKDGEYILVVNKEQYIYGYHLQLDGNDNINILSQTVTIGLRDMYASGVTQMGDKSFVISSIEGGIEVVKAVLGDSGIQLEGRRVNENKTSDHHFHYNGMAVSPNKTLLAYVQRPPPGYDHLSAVWKRSTKLVIKKMDHVTEELVSNILMEHKGPLSKLADVVECYRQTLVSSPFITYTNEENMSKRELILIRLALLSKTAQINSKSLKLDGEYIEDGDKSRELREEAGTICVRITGLYIQQCVNCLTKQEPISESDSRVLGYFQHFLEKHADTLSETVDVGQLQTSLTDIMKGSPPNLVSCPACDFKLTMDKLSWHCGNGHSFDSCCHTLTPCIDMDHRICLGCQAVSLSQNVLKEYPWLPDINSCVLCESFVI